ncbi:hypothetical protein IMZ48_32035 [Candidatus Bathyarchaeota archaeon]|nr:hypothetical protein [Candidatus Bathyarchaeota archaeon]
MDIYKGRPENPTPEGRDWAPKEKAAGLDAQILKDKFAGKPPPVYPVVMRKIEWDRSDMACLRQEAHGGRLAYGPECAVLPERP